MLKNAKALGDKLIVGVLTDKAVMEKKPKPIFSFSKRIQLIQSLKFVDCAVPQKDYSPFNNIKSIKPDILIESESHIKYKYLDEIKKEFKGRIVMLPYYPEVSSSEIKKNIRRSKWKKSEEGLY